MAMHLSPMPETGEAPRVAPGACLTVAATALVGWLLHVGAGWQLAQILSGLAAFAVLGGIVALAALRRPALARFGLPNQVTLLRAGLVCLAGGSLWASGAAQDWALPALVACALALDLVDGWLARRLNLVSAFGARFDLEVDAFLLFILAFLVWQADQTGAWVLLIGLLRYAFVLAGFVWQELRAPLYPSLRRRALCGVQGATLLLCLLPPVAPVVAVPLAAFALAGLSASFAIDVAWLLRRTPVEMRRLD